MGHPVPIHIPYCQSSAELSYLGHLGHVIIPIITWYDACDGCSWLPGGRLPPRWTGGRAAPSSWPPASSPRTRPASSPRGSSSTRSPAARWDRGALLLFLCTLLKYFQSNLMPFCPSYKGPILMMPECICRATWGPLPCRSNSTISTNPQIFPETNQPLQIVNNVFTNKDSLHFGMIIYYIWLLWRIL